MKVLLDATDERTAVNSFFQDVPDETTQPQIERRFSWWGELLRREQDTYEQNDPRRAEIDRILHDWRI